MSKNKFLYFFLLFCSAQLAVAQNMERIKKLKDLIATGKDDTMKVRRLIDLSAMLNTTDFKTAIMYTNDALTLSKKINDIKGTALAYGSFADAFWYHSDYEKAQQYYFKSYRISDSIHDKASIAYSLYNIGWIICIQQHNYKQDKYLYQSLQLYNELNDPSGSLQIYNAMASYYADRFKVENAKQYFDSAIVYFNKGITLAQNADMHSDLGRIYGNMGDLFYVGKDFSSAAFYNSKSLEIHQRVNDSSSMNICFLNIGLCELATGHVKEALSKFKRVHSYNLRHDIKDVELIVLPSLAKAYYQLNDFKQAYDYYENYVALKEVLDKEAYSTSISNLQGNYSLEKAEANVAQLRQTNEIQELKNKKNSYFIFVLIAVAIAVIIVASLLFRQSKIRHQSNIQLQRQNNIIAEKKQEIDNSIQYAKGIQLAFLPDKQELDHRFEDNFIYYKPKDVVSGDFYWFSKVENDFYCIAADCTGHGVPGALMSIIGVDKIVQAVFEKKLSLPGDILSYLNREIKQVLKQHSDASKQMDGMDIAILKFNKASDKVEYAGANRPLYLIRNNELKEYKADKTAIAGFTPVDQVFKTTSIDLQKNDSLYIFTDGYADQFGGNDGKKMMTKNLKNLLVSMADMKADDKYRKVEKTFLDWKGPHEQVDDVLIIGIKI
jgi:serine phosphatase RsbU (regulator of sigma subunit)